MEIRRLMTDLEELVTAFRDAVFGPGAARWDRVRMAGAVQRGSREPERECAGARLLLLDRCQPRAADALDIAVGESRSQHDIAQEGE